MKIRGFRILTGFKAPSDDRHFFQLLRNFHGRLKNLLDMQEAVAYNTTKPRIGDLQIQNEEKWWTDMKPFALDYTLGYGNMGC